MAACTYRGELLGLMAINLILLAADKVRPDLTGSVDVYSDCIGALEKVSDLPPNRILSRCRHSDILKNIMVNCSDLSFDLTYLHVRAHQDDDAEYHSLSHPSQLNLSRTRSGDSMEMSSLHRKCFHWNQLQSSLGRRK